MTATESPTLVDQPRILPPLPPGYEFAGFGVEVEKTYGRSLDAGHVLVVTGRGKFSSRDVFRTELRACETLLKRSKAESAEMRERMRANTVVILNMRDRIDELTGATS